MATAGMDEPPEYDIIIQKGAEFSLPVILEDDEGPIDLTDFSFAAALYNVPGGNVLMTMDIQAVALTAGSVRLYAAASSTALIGAVTGQGYKDASPPAKFFPGYFKLLGALSAVTATQNVCYLRGIAKVYP